MEHPVQYLVRVTRFLDKLIQEQGDYLFVGFAFLCFILIGWILARRRKGPVHDFPVVILPLGQKPHREESLKPPFEEEGPDL